MIGKPVPNVVVKIQAALTTSYAQLKYNISPSYGIELLCKGPSYRSIRFGVRRVLVDRRISGLGEPSGNAWLS